jgi:hypothetical protein
MMRLRAPSDQPTPHVAQNAVSTILAAGCASVVASIAHHQQVKIAPRVFARRRCWLLFDRPSEDADDPPLPARTEPQNDTFAPTDSLAIGIAGPMFADFNPLPPPRGLKPSEEI